MDIIDALERTKEETLTYFDLADGDLRKRYGPDKWSIRYLLHHLADSEATLMYRIKRVISEPQQVIWVVDQDAWAQRLNYAAVPLELAKRVYASSRDSMIDCARRHYAGSEAVSFVHSTTGLRTLRDEFDKVPLHNRLHLGHIESALRG